VWLTSGRKVPFDYAATRKLEIARTGDSVAECSPAESTRTLQKVRVYDILNAGPRHRFTVSGHLVSNCHFGILFGIAKHNLYEFIKAMDPTSDVSEEFVSNAFDNYFKRYPGMAAFIEKQRAFAETHGYVETLFGLHRALNITEQRGAFDDQGDGEYIEDAAAGHASWKNQAINTPVQGSAHQLMECGLVNFRRKHDKYKILGLPTMEVHDALYFMVNALELHECFRKAKYLMEQESLNTLKEDFPDIHWRVPIVVEAEAGLRLGGKIELPDDKFTIGGFMLQWYRKTKKQIIELRKQLAEVPDAAENV
jgi:hypothetical protein